MADSKAKRDAVIKMLATTHKISPEAAKALYYTMAGVHTTAAIGGAVVAYLQRGSATGELAAQLIAKELYPGIKPENLTNEQKANVSALSTLGAGLAVGVAGNSSVAAATGGIAGKTAVENNYLSEKQKTQSENEFDACKDSTAFRLQVGSKWDLIDAGQQTSYGAGMLVSVTQRKVSTEQLFNPVHRRFDHRPPVISRVPFPVSIAAGKPLPGHRLISVRILRRPVTRPDLRRDIRQKP